MSFGTRAISCCLLCSLSVRQFFSQPPFSSPLLHFSLFLTVFTRVSWDCPTQWDLRKPLIFKGNASLSLFVPEHALPFLLCNGPPGHVSPLPRLLRGHRLTADSLGNRKVIADPSCRLRTRVTVGFSMLRVLLSLCIVASSLGPMWNQTYDLSTSIYRFFFSDMVSVYQGIRVRLASNLGWSSCFSVPKTGILDFINESILGFI